MGIQINFASLERFYVRRFKWLAVALAITAGLGTWIYFSSSAQTPVDAVATAGAPLVRFQASSAQSTTDVGSVSSGLQGATDGKSLARALQTGLNRARCYDGPINGNWTTKSKDAMRRFVVATNAQLPVEYPDQILLALVESNHTAVCAKVQEEASTGTGEVLPKFVAADTQLDRQISAKSSNIQPASHMAGVDNSLDDLISSENSAQAKNVVVAPIAVEVEKPAAPIANNSNDVQASSQIERRPPAPKKAVQRRINKQKSISINGVSKSITKSVKSIQRSLASLFN